MSIARSAGVFLGTDETTGDTITSGSTDAGTEKDVLGNDTSAGELELFLCATCTVATGTIDVYVDRQRVTGGAYANSSPIIQVTPKNGTVKYSLGRIAASRYMTGKVINNGIGASLTNVTLGYELFKVS